MIVAITGGTGFIGRKLVQRHLARGDAVRVLTRGPANTLPAGVECFSGDLLDQAAQLAPFVEQADILYHCAGEITDESNMHKLHVEGTARLVQAASGRIGRWVQLSSVGAYGPRSAGTIAEETAEHPVGVYETTKTVADKLVREAAEEGAFSCTTLRPSTVFGNDMPNQSLTQWVAAIQRGLFFFIGKPGAVVNYVHVDSVVDALLLGGTAEAANSRLYIVSEALMIERFVALICQELGRPEPALRLPGVMARSISAAGRLCWAGFPLTRSRIDALTNRAIYSSALIREELGYEPSLPLEQGLRDFVAHWRVHGR